MLTLASVLGRWRGRRLRRVRRAAPRPARAAGLPPLPPLPPGLDVEHFLGLARMSFLHLQAAWDAGDMGALERLTTGPLRAELREQLQTRGEAANRTEVLDLQATLLAFEELQEAFVASIEFTGVIREAHDAAAADFRELWLLTHLKADDISPDTSPQAWQLAQVQALA
jgi:predicted lipid-binding transport protein (Tim44 family)